MWCMSCDVLHPMYAMNATYVEYALPVRVCPQLVARMAWQEAPGVTGPTTLLRLCAECGQQTCAALDMKRDLSADLQMCFDMRCKDESEAESFKLWQLCLLIFRQWIWVRGRERETQHRDRSQYNSVQSKCYFFCVIPLIRCLRISSCVCPWPQEFRACGLLKPPLEHVVFSRRFEEHVYLIYFEYLDVCVKVLWEDAAKRKVLFCIVMFINQGPTVLTNLSRACLKGYAFRRQHHGYPLVI